MNVVENKKYFLLYKNLNECVFFRFQWIMRKMKIYFLSWIENNFTLVNFLMKRIDEMGTQQICITLETARCQNDILFSWYTGDEGNV